MRESSDNLLKSLKSIKTNCQLLLKKRTKQVQDTQESENKMDSLMKLADKIKMLIDIPESIWNTLQTGDLIESTTLYKQSNLIYSELNQENKEASVRKNLLTNTKIWVGYLIFAKVKLENKKKKIFSQIICPKFWERNYCEISFFFFF